MALSPGSVISPGTLNNDLHCSLCNGPLMVYEVHGGGIKVRCENPCDPSCHENPEGFGNTPKAAHEILKHKYKKS